MKNYLHVLMVVVLMVVLVTPLSLFAGQVNTSASTDCVPGKTYDTRTGTPCANIATCLPGVILNHITGALCKEEVPDDVYVPHDYYADYLATTLKTVKRGVKNSLDAAYLQAFLSENDLLDTKYITSYYGTLTTSALKAFQAKSGLRPDGLYGPLTLEAIQTAIMQNPSSARNIATRAQLLFSQTRTPTNNTAATNFTEGLDLTQESVWGTPVKYENGQAAVYVRDFGLDPNNGLLNVVVTYVDRVPQSSREE
jgi:hypothetical protein